MLYHHVIHILNNESKPSGQVKSGSDWTPSNIGIHWRVVTIALDQCLAYLWATWADGAEESHCAQVVR